MTAQAWADGCHGIQHSHLAGVGGAVRTECSKVVELGVQEPQTLHQMQELVAAAADMWNESVFNTAYSISTAHLPRRAENTFQAFATAPDALGDDDYNQNDSVVSWYSEVRGAQLPHYAAH